MSGNMDILSKCAAKLVWKSVRRDIEVYLSQSFKKIDKNFDCTHVRYLQFRLLYRRIFTNELLYRMKIVDRPECPLCNNTPKKIEHAFIWCQKTHTQWRQIELWLSMVLKYKIKTSDSEKNSSYCL